MGEVHRLPRKGKGNRTGARCPICRRPSVAEWRPFCSARCKQVDLGRWLSGTYRIETEEGPVGGEPGGPEEPDRRP